MEESVLRGNAVILKCHISTFVTEYVSVSSWIISEGDTEELEIKPDDSDNLGRMELHSYNKSVSSSLSLINICHRVFASRNLVISCVGNGFLSYLLACCYHVVSSGVSSVHR